MAYVHGIKPQWLHFWYIIKYNYKCKESRKIVSDICTISQYDHFSHNGGS